MGEDDNCDSGSMTYIFIETVLLNFSQEYRVYLELETSRKIWVIPDCGTCFNDFPIICDERSGGHSKCKKTWKWEKDI